MEKTLRTIEEYIADPEFDVKTFSRKSV